LKRNGTRRREERKKNRKRVKGNQMRRNIWEISARAVWIIERKLSNVAHYTISGKMGTT
jgi:hypothetical protein